MASIHEDERVKKIEIDLSKGECVLLKIKHTSLLKEDFAELIIDVSNASLSYSNGRLTVEKVSVFPVVFFGKEFSTVKPPEIE